MYITQPTKCMFYLLLLIFTFEILQITLQSHMFDKSYIIEKHLFRAEALHISVKWIMINNNIILIKLI